MHLFCGLLRSFIFRSPFRHKTEVLKVVCFIFRRQQQRRERRIKAATMPFFLPKRLQSATMCNLRPAKSTVFVLLPLSIIFLRTGTFQWISKIQAHLNASRDLPALHELPFIGHTNFFFHAHLDDIVILRPIPTTACEGSGLIVPKNTQNFVTVPPGTQRLYRCFMIISKKFDFYVFFPTKLDFFYDFAKNFQIFFFEEKKLHGKKIFSLKTLLSKR